MSDFNAQLQKMLQKQKIARVNNEHFTSVTILKEIISLCYNSQNWEKLYQQINFLMNRRGQGKKAQIQMIQLAMTWLNSMVDPQRTKLIETIRDVCAKKIYLQVQYARCILMIVKTKQNDNDIMEAANILQQVQVQTYGSMDRRQKLQFILYQMKIMIKKKDFVRLYIISKKINQANINDDEIADIKITYFSYLTIYYNHMNEYKECCRCYKTIWTTLKNTKKKISQQLDFGFSANLNNVLSNYIGFLVLQPFSESNQKQLKALQQDQQLQNSRDFWHVINNFLSEQIVTCNIEAYHPNSFELFRQSYQNSKNHLHELRRMLVQHNIRVISKYYGQLTLTRISDLIKQDKLFCEQELCTLNNNGLIKCRVDRIDDNVDFRPVQNETFIINRWNQSVNSILDLIDVASNLIHREREVYRK